MLFRSRDKTTLELNTLGDAESRQAYRTALLEFLRARKAKLSAESQERLERNPLRVLDSKDEGDRAIVQDAPRNTDHLTQAAADFFKRVRDGLDALGVRYEINPFLVRGLDYYCHSAFEFTTTHLGAQSAVLAGGRYDGLIETMGGQPTPGVGWAAGIERLAMLIDEPEAPTRPVALVPIGPAAEALALTLANELRHAGLNVELGFRGNLSKRMKHADKVQARAALIIGDDEIAKGAYTLRDLDTGAQEPVERARLIERLSRT